MTSTTLTLTVTIREYASIANALQMMEDDAWRQGEREKALEVRALGHALADQIVGLSERATS